MQIAVCAAVIAGNRSPSQFEGIDIHHACFGDRII